MKRAILLVTLLGIGSAAADSKKDRAATEFAEGQRLFKNKDYEQAAERFKAAFAADEDPVYLFNAATALRLAKKCTESRDYYRKFLAAAPDTPNKDKIGKALVEVEACAAKEKPVADQKPDPVPDPKPKPAPQPDPKPDKLEVVAPPARRSPEDPGRGRRRAGLVAMTAGVVSGAAGVFFVTRVGAAERDREALCPAPCVWTDELVAKERDLDDRGKRSSLLAVTSLSLAGVAVTTGLVLYLTGRSSPERVSVTPTSNGAVIQAGFRF